jgi:hypothetical protein
MSASPGAAKQGLATARLAVPVLVACCVSGTLIAGACFVAPPPDLPSQPPGRPTILHDSVVPPGDQILTSGTIPANGMFTFLIPIEVDDPNLEFSWRVFVDFDPYTTTVPVKAASVQPSSGGVDAGVIVVSFDLSFGDLPLSTPYCHRIDFVVASSFANKIDKGIILENVPTQGVVADSVRWLYAGPDGMMGCAQSFDASAFGDGGLTIPDAAPDGLPVVPESGSDP